VPASSPGAERYTIVPGSSKATYRVNETFVGRGFAVAVGSTGAFSGALYLDKTRPSASRIDPITVDISKLASDSSQRDNRIRRSWLESSTYPTATFVTRRLEGLPDTPYAEGQELTFTIVGDLTVRDVTREVTWDARGQIVGDTFAGTATTQFNMTDFGFDPPEIAGVLKAENGVILELAIEARRDQ
jgi:polyisoprenoid-binding protein YceI